MGQYTVYYEIGRHKMKSTVTALTKHDAIDIVKSKIKIHKVDVDITGTDNTDVYRGLFNKILNIK